MADRPQVGPHPARGPGLRRRAADRRAQARGLGLPELGRHRHRRRALLQARPQPRHRRPARRPELVPHEVADDTSARTTWRARRPRSSSPSTRGRARRPTPPAPRPTRPRKRSPPSWTSAPSAVPAGGLRRFVAARHRAAPLPRRQRRAVGRRRRGPAGPSRAPVAARHRQRPAPDPRPRRPPDHGQPVRGLGVLPAQRPARPRVGGGHRSALLDRARRARGDRRRRDRGAGDRPSPAAVAAGSGRRRAPARDHARARRLGSAAGPRAAPPVRRPRHARADERARRAHVHGRRLPLAALHRLGERSDARRPGPAGHAVRAVERRVRSQRAPARGAGPLHPPRAAPARARRRARPPASRSSRARKSPAATRS